MSLLKKTPQFGSIETTKILDDNGSTRTDSTNYIEGEIKRPIRHTYTFREKVFNQLEARQKQEDFMQELEDNNVMLDPMLIRVDISTL